MLETVKYLIGAAGPSGYGSKSTAEEVTESCPDLRSITAIITGNDTTWSNAIMAVKQLDFFMCFDAHQAVRRGSGRRRLGCWPCVGRGWSSRRGTSRRLRTPRHVSWQSFPSPRSSSCRSILALFLQSEISFPSSSPSDCPSISSCKYTQKSIFVIYFILYILLICFLRKQRKRKETPSSRFLGNQTLL
jgi:hypothetical protein